MYQMVAQNVICMLLCYLNKLLEDNVFFQENSKEIDISRFIV